MPYVPPAEPSEGRRRWLYIAAVAALLLLCGGFYAVIAAVTGDDDEATDEQAGATAEAADEQATTVALALEGTQTAIAAQPTPTLAATVTLPATALATATPLVLGQPNSNNQAATIPAGVPVAPVVGGPSDGGGAALLIAKHGEDSLFVMNAGDNQPLALGPLRLGDGSGAISGSEWQVGSLAPNACVTAWKDGGNPEAPGISCAQVGAELVRDGPNRFWKSSFNVYYNERLIGTCASERCLMDIVG